MINMLSQLVLEDLILRSQVDFRQRQYYHYNNTHFHMAFREN